MTLEEQSQLPDAVFRCMQKMKDQKPPEQKTDDGKLNKIHINRTLGYIDVIRDDKNANSGGYRAAEATTTDE